MHLTHIFGCEEIHAFGDLVGEAEQILSVNRQVILIITPFWDRKKEMGIISYVQFNSLPTDVFGVYLFV